MANLKMDELDVYICGDTHKSDQKLSVFKFLTASVYRCV